MMQNIQEGRHPFSPRWTFDIFPNKKLLALTLAKLSGAKKALAEIIKTYFQWRMIWPLKDHFRHGENDTSRVLKSRYWP